MIEDKYQGNLLRLALQYRRAGIPEPFWFNEYQGNRPLVDGAVEYIDRGRWLVIFAKDMGDQFGFIAEILKRRPQDKPRFQDFGSLVVKFAGRYTKYDALEDMDFGLLGVAGIRNSGYYKQHVEDFLTYLYKAFGKQGASLVLGFQQVGESQERSVYGAEMTTFLESNKFTYLTL